VHRLWRAVFLASRALGDLSTVLHNWKRQSHAERLLVEDAYTTGWCGCTGFDREAVCEALCSLPRVQQEMRLQCCICGSDRVMLSGW
jgi:hypothetical protein